MPNCYAFLDKKSGVLSNHFITDEPFEKIKQNISISLLQLSLKDPTNPFVLFAKDYDLVWVTFVECLYSDVCEDSQGLIDNVANLDQLLAASRKAFESRSNHTSQNEDSPEPKE